MALVLKRPVIAITGSSGKTTCKEMVASILSRRWRVFKSRANWNDTKSMRKYAREIKPYHQIVVLEYGISSIDEIRRSCKVIQPNIAVITMIGTAHIGKAGSTVGGLIAAKSDLVLNMKQDGLLYLNADDANSLLLDTSKFLGKIYTVGIEKQADYQASCIQYIRNGMTFKVMLDLQEFDFRIPVFGRHNVYNALFAIAVCYRLGVPAADIQKGLASYHKPSRRLRVYNARNGITIIDDTWNSNPDAVKAAVDVLTNVGGGKNIAVLGAMAELGRYSQEGHQEIGRYLERKSIGHLFTFGREARLIGEAAVASGLPPDRVIHSIDRSTMHKRLREEIKPGTTILVKGSHGMHMEKTVDFLRRAFAKSI